MYCRPSGCQLTLSLLPCLAQWSRVRVALGPFLPNFLFFTSYFFQTLTFSKPNQNSSFWGDFLYTCQLMYLFYDSAKIFRKNFHPIIFWSSRKRYFWVLFKAPLKVIFSNFRSPILFKTSYKWTSHFKNTFKIFFSKLFIKLASFSMIDPIKR